MDQLRPFAPACFGLLVVNALFPILDREFTGYRSDFRAKFPCSRAIVGTY